MVTLREQIEYEGLKVSIEPTVEKPFYLTGEISSFSVVVENPTNQERHGKLAFSWSLGEVTSYRIITFEVQPLSTSKCKLMPEWLYREGTAIYNLIHMDRPPENYSTEADMLRLSWEHRGHVDPLCSYYVRDKDLHLYEEKYRKAMRSFPIITIILTIVNLVIVTYPYWRFIIIGP